MMKPMEQKPNVTDTSTNAAHSLPLIPVLFSQWLVSLVAKSTIPVIASNAIMNSMIRIGHLKDLV